MDTLRIQLFGQLRVYQGERCLNKFPTNKAQHLFCYLVLHRQRCHSRNVLAGLFWGDSPEEQARKCLRTSLWRLRSLLEPDRNLQGAYLIIENDEICFNTHTDYWLDVEEFERLADSRWQMADGSPNQDATSHLQSAISLYQGDLLEGCYEDWCLYERERLKEMFLSALAKLMACHRRGGAYEEAIRCGNRILSYDPLLEEVHREIMRLHCLAGNRGAALRQYRLCQTILAQELGIEPMEETTALYTQIRHSEDTKGGNREIRDTSSSSLASQVDGALSELRLVQAGFQQLSARFQRGVETLETLREVLGQTRR